MAKDHFYYEADITPLNAEKIGTSAHGKATFEITPDDLLVKIEMDGTPANTQHWEHFHGFADGKDAQVATAAQDANGDGWIDLPETEPVSGTTMVPFNDEPEKLDVLTDTYPVSDEHGHFSYEKKIPIEVVEAKFNEFFHDDHLHLEKRVLYIHGVPKDMDLPESVQGTVGHYDAHTTLPIAVGKIKRVNKK